MPGYLPTDSLIYSPNETPASARREVRTSELLVFPVPNCTSTFFRVRGVSSGEPCGEPTGREREAAQLQDEAFVAGVSTEVLLERFA
jgi:hypothetical protein